MVDTTSGSSSPVPVQVKVELQGMTFPQAMEKVLSGEKVRRNDWPEEAYGHLKDSFLMVNNTGKEDRQWLVSEADMTATDWELTD